MAISVIYSFLICNLLVFGQVWSQSLDPVDLAMNGAALYSSPGPGKAATNPAWSAFAVDHQLLLAGNLQAPMLENTDLAPAGTSLSGMKPDPYQAAKADSLGTGSMGIDLLLAKFLGLSVGITMPASRLARIQTYSGQEANYLRFDGRNQKPEISTGLGLAFGKYLAFGGGIYHSFKAKGQLQLAVSDSDADARMAMELLPDMIPYVTLAWRSNPEGDSWMAGARYRAQGDAPTEIEIDTSFNIEDSGSIPLSAGTNLIAFYTPETYSLGLGRMANSWQWHMAWDYERWGHYQAPMISLIGRDLTRLTGGVVDYDPISMENTHRLAMGGGLKLAEGDTSLWIFSGLAYEESAMKTPVTSLAILDNDKWSGSLGVKRLFKIRWPSDLDLDLRAGARFTKIKEENFSMTSSRGVQKTAHVGGGIWDISLGGALVF